VVLVRLTSKGPGIYRQARVGKDGRRFMMYKIRTMRQDAEASTGPVWTHPRDPRVTPIGRLLRKLHLDELPQLFNVIRGEMALVGPRPERPEFVCVLAEAVPGYRNRLAVLPGITGLAQINLPPDTDLVSVQRKVVLDCEYIQRGGPWLDTRLMLCTFLRLFKLPEGWLHSLFALTRDPNVPCPLTTEPGHPLAGHSETSEEAEAATPATILLQLASVPESAADPAPGNISRIACRVPDGNGDSVDHTLRHGNGAPSHRAVGNISQPEDNEMLRTHRRSDGVDIRHGKRSDHGKPR
jgi:lipopolysaccharide/colanic/teichoic acid biosynthesis glycosyltransferase